MLWLVGWIAVSILGICGALASLNSLRFGRRVAREVREMWTGATDSPLRELYLEDLPVPVQRYATQAIAARRAAARTVRLRHGGSFRTKLDGPWLSIKGEQYFSADPPGFLWWGRVRILPGVWVDARDRSVGGVANMLVSAESTVELADSAGSDLDQSALLRLLGEMAWFPPALFDRQYVTWTPIDNAHARATLRLKGHEVAGIFEFGNDGLPVTFSADRHRDLGDGRSVMTPFSGECSDYRWVEGMLVPHQMNGYWHVGGERIPYVRFRVERIEYDAREPF